MRVALTEAWSTKIYDFLFGEKRRLFILQLNIV